MKTYSFLYFEIPFCLIRFDYVGSIPNWNQVFEKLPNMDRERELKCGIHLHVEGISNFL